MSRLTLPVAFVVIALAGCSDKSESSPARETRAGKPGDVTAAKPGDTPAPTHAPRPTRPTLLAAGATVPAFSGKSHIGKTISTATLKGKPAVIYFYPKDFTPG